MGVNGLSSDYLHSTFSDILLLLIWKRRKYNFRLEKSQANSQSFLSEVVYHKTLRRGFKKIRRRVVYPLTFTSLQYKYKSAHFKRHWSCCDGGGSLTGSGKRELRWGMMEAAPPSTSDPQVTLIWAKTKTKTRTMIKTMTSTNTKCLKGYEPQVLSSMGFTIWYKGDEPSSWMTNN